VADRDNLVPQANPDDEGAGSTSQDGIEAVVGAVERRDDTAAAQPDKEERGREAAHLAARPAAGYWNCAWARKKQEQPKILKNFFDNFINRKSISLQKFVGQDNWSAKNCRGKTSVFPRLCTEAEEKKR
jgi:hypothetical protein